MAEGVTEILATHPRALMMYATMGLITARRTATEDVSLLEPTG
jgi:hypothetical protein